MNRVFTPTLGRSSLYHDWSCFPENNGLTDSPEQPYEKSCYSDKELSLTKDRHDTPSDTSDVITLQSEPTESARSASPVRKRQKRMLRKTRSRISQAEWEAVKNIISHLYLEKDYTLSTVREIMSKAPHNFNASPKMYKCQFETWGFVKNLTKHRVRNILDPISIKAKIASTFSAARIDRYLKRTKKPQATTGDETGVDRNQIYELSDDSIQELSDTSFDAMFTNLSPLCYPAPTPSVSHSSDSCMFLERGCMKYAIALDTDVSYGLQLVAESWGQQEYHSHEERQCSKSCRCRNACGLLGQSTEHIFGRCTKSSHLHGHRFAVIYKGNSVFVDIYSSLLRVLIGESIPQLEPFFGLSRLGVSGANTISAIHLLRHYRELKALVNCDHSGTEWTEAEQLDLELLVNGLLEDSDVWEHLGMEQLNQEGFLDESLLGIFTHQRLMRGIQSLNALFKRLGDGFHPTVEPRSSGLSQLTNQIHELDASPSSGVRFNLETWNHHRQPVNETSCSSSPSTLPESLTRRLPGHYILDNFHNDLTQEFPQLISTVSRGSNHQIVFSEELSNFHTPESFTCFDAHISVQRQTDLDMKLVAACKSGTWVTINSLLCEGASPSCLADVDGKISSPMIAAIEGGNEKVVRLLALRGASLEDMAVLEVAGETLQYTALWAATQTNQASIVQFLLERGADLNGRCTAKSKATLRSFTCMSEAARLGLTAMFKLLLEWGTSYSEGLKEMKLVHDLHPEADQGKRLFEEIKTGSLPKFIEALENVNNPNIVMSEGTPLSIAAKFNQPHKIKALLERGADIQLASLCLFRSGQEQTAKALVKTVYGSHDIHVNFARQYERLVQLSRSTCEEKLRSFRHTCSNYRQAWAMGIEVMQNICRGKPPEGPDCLHRTLDFLAVARAVAETAAGETGDINLLDKFDTDLLRYQLLFPHNQDLSPYRLAVFDLWKVNLEGSFFLDLDFQDSDTLGRFNGLISRLIAGARVPLGLDNSGHGLNETSSRWRQRHQNDLRATAPAPTVFSVQTNDARTDVQEEEQLETPSESTASVPCDKIMNREMILKKTSWLDPGSKSATSVFFFEFTSVAEHLIRGIVFSIVFVFIHGLRSLARLYMEKSFGLVERFTVLLRVLGFLEACERVSYRKLHDGTPKLLHEQDTVMEAVHLEGIRPATILSNQWYNLISCSADIWI